MRSSYLLCLAFLFTGISCRSPRKPTLFDKVDDSGIDFSNKVVDGQIENSFYYRNYYNGGGVSIGDINNDGLCDVLMTSNMGDNKLYLNKGSLKFQDITAGSGLVQDSMWSTGVMMVDINNDGWLDIYICNSGHMGNGNRRNKLYINNQKLGFRESAKEYGLDISAYSTQVSFFDYDLDGDLDCFMIDNSPMPINNLGYTNRRDLPDAQWPVADFLKGGGDHLYRNDNNHFSEVTREAGIHGTLISFGLGVSIGDINMDGYPDVYVANDSYERDYLYINQHDGTFKDELEDWMEQNSFSSMGADLADINNDGYMDVFTTDMLPGDDYRLKTLGAFDNIDLYNTRIRIGFYRQFMKNCLFVNNQHGKFLETANYSGVSASDWSWGALFFDADNDGLNDIYICNGVNRDVTNLDFMDFFANDVVQKMVVSGRKDNVDSVLMHIPINPVPNKVFHNDGNYKFSDVGVSWGLGDPSFSNGAAYGDLDNDGDLDLVVNNQNEPAFVYRNNSREQTRNSYIGVMLKGSSSNSYAIGSKIRIFQGSQIFYREVVPSRGFQSSVDYKQIIGLGTLKAVDSMQIIWPNNTCTSIIHPELNKVHVLREDSQVSRPYNYPGAAPSEPLLSVVPNTMDRHSEDEYSDFYFERNLPEILSHEGPALASADVNGDGLTDVYIGGAKNQPGQLYLQEPTGNFRKQPQKIFSDYADFEDVAALFFDADADGDPDLFIGAGGNNVEPASRALQHRLYLNDGKGNFQIDLKAFPNNDMNIAVCVANDYDGDGDLDLFVGSRSVPFNYGITPRSYLYNNDGKGHFTDVTERSGGGLSKVGMVTGAVWADLDKDRQNELIVTGEWMATRVFEYNRKTSQFAERTGTGLEKLIGWWQAIAAADLDNDGDADLVIGNTGKNFYLQPATQAPIKLWLNDFDQNGTTEQFLTRTIGQASDSRDVPVFLKREITDQFPGLKKQNLKHSDYGRKSIQELFNKDLMAKSAVKEFNYAASIEAINDGTGHFTVRELPLEVQLSSVNAILVADVNGDEINDLVMGGNMFTFPPQFGRLDASYGHVLLGMGNGSFYPADPANQGLAIREEIRGIAALTGKSKSFLLFARNNEQPVLVRINQTMQKKLP